MKIHSQEMFIFRDFQIWLKGDNDNIVFAHINIRSDWIFSEMVEAIMISDYRAEVETSLSLSKVLIVVVLVMLLLLMRLLVLQCKLNV